MDDVITTTTLIPSIIIYVMSCVGIIALYISWKDSLSSNSKTRCKRAAFFICIVYTITFTWHVYNLLN
jgi:hypothetical protein